MFLFYAVHYPHPEKVELLIRSMREVGELIKKQPGLVLVDTFQDPDNGTLLGVSLWRVGFNITRRGGQVIGRAGSGREPGPAG
jgi:hypothetical protein